MFLRYMFVIEFEFADLFMTAGGRVETPNCQSDQIGQDLLWHCIQPHNCHAQRAMLVKP